MCSMTIREFCSPRSIECCDTDLEIYYECSRKTDLVDEDRGHTQIIVTRISIGQDDLLIDDPLMGVVYWLHET